MTPALLNIESVRRTYHPAASAKRIVAVEDVSFSVFEGEIVVLLGPSGCGKTSLLRIAAGLDFPDSGRADFRAAPILGPGRERGMVFQAYSSFPWLTALDNVKFGLRYRPGLVKSEADMMANDLIKLVGLEGFESNYVSELSGGMQQRLALARTLAADPSLLLMDEPFGALDAQTRELLQVVLIEIQAQAKKAVLFVTHDVEEALFLADRIIMLSARPAIVREEIRVGLPRLQGMERKELKEFEATRKRLLHAVRSEATRQAGTVDRFTARSIARRDEHSFSERRH